MPTSFAFVRILSRPTRLPGMNADRVRPYDHQGKPMTYDTARIILLTGAIALLGAADTPIDRFHGEYTVAGGPVVQVVALGKDEYRAHVLETIEKRVDKPLAVLWGKVEGDAIAFIAEPKDKEPKGGSWWKSPESSQGWTATLVPGQITINQPNAGAKVLKPLDRTSPTLGAKPPAGAIVLLGPETRQETLGDTFQKLGTKNPLGWKILDGGVMEVVPKAGNAHSKVAFGSHRLHLEFRLAYEPTMRSQKRSNSGMYVQGRYEVQVLDSFGLEGVDNECGGIYKATKPIVNRCLPPGMWQTYDVDFTTSVWEGGKQVKPAVITVLHNGLPIYDQYVLEKGTPGGCKLDANKATGVLDPEGLVLQDHGNLVQFRNIWVVPVR